MADISIDGARAKIWIADVKAELEAVDAILKNVQGALTNYAGSNDSILQGVVKIGTNMETTWTQMCNRFSESTKEVTSAIEKTINTVIDVAEKAAEVAGHVNQC